LCPSAFNYLKWAFERHADVEKRMLPFASQDNPSASLGNADGGGPLFGPPQRVD
jgi:hypothetical protein